jgi:hypothetical protein
VGTVFESSHVPLNLWLQAGYLMCSSKKGVSSHQLMSVQHVQYKAAWFMTHRIREAIKAGSLPPMGGEGTTIEIDETYNGKKGKTSANARGYAHKHAVLTLVKRGGSARSFHVDGTKAANLMPIIRANVKPGTAIMTDEAGQHYNLKREFPTHDVVRHGKGEYVRGAVHTNTVEGFYSVFKRGIKVSISTAAGGICIATSRSSISAITTAHGWDSMIALALPLQFRASLYGG